MIDILHMKSGNEESSYATNSFLQETVIRKVRPILKETITKISSNFDGFPKCFNIADLGCSSGPNTLLVLSNIIDEVHEVCKDNKFASPQLHVFSNDLIVNDFNSIFKSLPIFFKNYKMDQYGPCFISATPGSFYGTLFSNNSIHLFHSSYSLHWLSQVPKCLETNRLHIYMAKASPPCVFEAYKTQFSKDFTTFLEWRSNEITDGGRMVLSFLGRSKVNPSMDDSALFWELLAKSLVDLVKKGMIQESKLESFNMPIYTPHENEVRVLVQNQGSFVIDNLETFEINWNPYDNDLSNVSSNESNHGKRIAKIVQAVTEPLLVTHFGSISMDLLFKKFEQYANEQVATQKLKHFQIAISLRKV